MKISIFGLGYVGAVSAACLANEGHTVIGVDPQQAKIDLINAGKTPIIEEKVGELIADGVAQKRLFATQDVTRAVMETQLSLICVGTPSQPNGGLNLSYVERVCEEIGAVIKQKNEYHAVVCRSTMIPGTMRTLVIPTLEKASGKKLGEGFGVAINPEFLREGSAVYDYNHPPKVVIGSMDTQSGDLTQSLYDHLDAPMIRTALDVAEMVKYTDNVWHALKVCFGNEIGTICKPLGVDSHQVMDIFCQDKKLNLSPYYLKPGFAFGGSCLPKDVRALLYKARSLDLNVPILESIIPSNERQIARGIELITGLGSRKVGVLGFSFKAGTDDLRESPVVTVIEHLIGKGYDLKLYDSNVQLARLVGANQDYIENRIPHISRLMVDSIDQIMQHAEIIIIGNNSDAFKEIPNQIREGQTVVDLVRIMDAKSGEGYEGICW
ncbi:MAG: nucleotide sugar dehydrogenase [Magnetococcales bacterium]|nr:nucleotide sugar dehydrogenase [Magnetococcales bacterium]